MEYAYATLLLNESGEELNERNLVDVLEAAGVAVELSRVKAIVAALEDVEVESVSAADLANGRDSTVADGNDPAKTVADGNDRSADGGDGSVVEGGDDQPLDDADGSAAAGGESDPER